MQAAVAGALGFGKPVLMYLTAGEVSDYNGARKLLGEFSAAKYLQAGRGYDANWFRDGLLKKKGIAPRIPLKKHQVDYDKTPYKQWCKVENMFGKLKDWRS